MNDVPEPVKTLVDAYETAVHAKDVDAFVGLYDHDVDVFDMWDRWSYSGIDAWRGMVSQWFDSLGDEQVSVEIADVRAVLTNDLGVAHAFVTYRALSAEGEQVRSMQNRLTWALKAADGGRWKIIHEHSSAPLDPETTKAIPRR